MAVVVYRAEYVPSDKAQSDWMVTSRHWLHGISLSEARRLVEQDHGTDARYYDRQGREIR